MTREAPPVTHSSWVWEIFHRDKKKQDFVALSSAKVEYVAATGASCQAIWLKRILEDMGELQTSVTEIFCDNKSAIAMAKNPVQQNRTKHIDIKYHFLRDVQAKGHIEMRYFPTEEQLADIFTKALPRDRFQFQRRMLGVTDKCIKEKY
ncbi:unnamed protein product [Cuscuta epithymum]|uniref:Copia protein n=1 Tax=Cuscuta epithymum TaxID=186058 RepID=A0AAV0EBX0_9ASTE|nr:unnamed protein product [Cuscuta epithymum]